MTNREPVNIMGVFAFPNPDKDKRDIRFIDSEYHTLFTIKDGESIVITCFDGEKMVFPCKYIDDCHVCIGNSAYHICEFAEMQERNGNIYVPAAPKISAEICTYEIYQIPATADVDYYSGLMQRQMENSRTLIISVLTPVCTQREIRWRICGQSTIGIPAPSPIGCVPCP